MFITFCCLHDFILRLNFVSFFLQVFLLFFLAQPLFCIATKDIISVIEINFMFTLQELHVAPNRIQITCAREQSHDSRNEQHLPRQSGNIIFKTISHQIMCNENQFAILFFSIIFISLLSRSVSSYEFYDRRNVINKAIVKGQNVRSIFY